MNDKRQHTPQIRNSYLVTNFITNPNLQLLKVVCDCQHVCKQHKNIRV